MRQRSSPLEAILDSAYRCFARNGFRRTTIADIAEEAGMSRPTVYKYVGSKEEAFSLVVQSLLDDALERAREVAGRDDPPADKIVGVLEAKLGVGIRLWKDSPAHAKELLATDSPRVDAYVQELWKLLADLLGLAMPGREQGVADILLTFTRGLEAELGDAEEARRRLHAGVRMIIAGAGASGPSRK